ncbi:MAG: Holliday junction resolvase RuvX [Mycoplasmoidaceae bacterium]
MNILAIDYGTKKFGLAIAFLDIPMPYEAIDHLNNAQTIRKIKEIVFEEKIDLIILGIPLNKLGADTQRSLLVKEFLNELKAEIQIEIKLVNEENTTKDSLSLFKDSNYSKKQIIKMKDSVSAFHILKRYLEI